MTLNKRKKVYIIITAIAMVLTFYRALQVSALDIRDEAFQILESYRLYRGDVPILDNWNVIFLHGMVTFPVISLYLLLTGTTTGLFLFVRIVTFILKTVLLLYGIKKLKCFSSENSVFYALLIFFIFSPFNINFYSYQQAAIFSGVYYLIVILKEKRNALDYLLLGLIYALNILSQPFMVISYPFILIFMLAEIIRNKNERFKKCIKWAHVGIILAVIYFLIFFAGRIRISELMENLPYLFNSSDHSYEGSPLMVMAGNVFKNIKDILLMNKFVTIINAICIMAFLFIPSEKKKNYYVVMHLCIVVSMVLMASTFQDGYYINTMFMPFVYYLVYGYIAASKKDKRLYVLCQCLVSFIVLSVMLSTNTGIRGVSATIILYGIVALIFWDGKSDSEIVRKANVLMPLLIVLITMAGHLLLNPESNRIAETGKIINDGPMKGLMASSEYYDSYYAIYNNIIKLDITNEDTLYCGQSIPLTYLTAQCRAGIPESCTFKNDYDRLATYFNMHKNKYPTVVYYFVITKEDTESAFFNDIYNTFDCQYQGGEFIAYKRK